jgi:hypothetical protein
MTDMKTELTATIVDGWLKPDGGLSLPEQTRVKVTIETIGRKPESSSAWEALKSRLRERPVHGGGRHFTRDELHERR